jgi:hypothetical protein
MVVMTVMTALCPVGVAFYVRFLVALYQGVQTLTDLLSGASAV